MCFIVLSISPQRYGLFLNPQRILQKNIFGKSSVADSLVESIGQCNRILLNLTVDYNTRSLAFAINRYFEVNQHALEVLIFKGRKKITVNRSMATKPDFLMTFKRLYEK